MKIIFVIPLSIDSPSDAQQRIDKFVRKYLPNAPLGGIFKWLRTGKIKVNKKKVEQTYRLELGDIIEFHFSKEELESFLERKEEKIHEAPQKALDVLFEDEYLIVINKPPGVNVHPGDHKTTEASLIELVQDSLGTKYNTLSFKPALVHRIDRDTSGCIIIAKEKKALEKLLEQLQMGQIQKHYHAIVIGNPPNRHGTIDAKLLRIEDARDEAKVRIDPLGQSALTHYHVQKEGIHGKYSLIECNIETGRTHQIRVHLASLGTPILGDKAYGNKKENSFAKREYSVTRQLLHAYSLAFDHPIHATKITLIAPYMHDMRSLLEAE